MQIYFVIQNASLKLQYLLFPSKNNERLNKCKTFVYENFYIIIRYACYIHDNAFI